MSQHPTPSQEITAEVTSWPGITAGLGRRGEFAFKLGGREVGHLHGDHAAHFFFAPDTWEQLRAEDRIGVHPVLPDRRGPASRQISGPDDVADVIAMMRLNYERVQAGLRVRAA